MRCFSDDVELPLETLAHYPDEAIEIVPQLLQVPDGAPAFLDVLELAGEFCSRKPDRNSLVRAKAQLLARLAHVAATADVPSGAVSDATWTAHDRAVVEVSALLQTLPCAVSQRELSELTQLGPRASPFVLLAALDAQRDAGVLPDAALIHAALDSVMVRREVLVRAARDRLVAAHVPDAMNRAHRIAERTVGAWLVHGADWGTLPAAVEHIERRVNGTSTYDLVRFRPRPTLNEPNPVWLVALHGPVAALRPRDAPVKTAYVPLDEKTLDAHFFGLLRSE